MAITSSVALPNFTKLIQMQALQNKEKSPWDHGIFPMDQLYKKDEKSDLRKGFHVQFTFKVSDNTYNV